MGRTNKLRKEKKKSHFHLEIFQDFLIKNPFQKEVNCFQKRAMNN